MKIYNQDWQIIYATNEEIKKIYNDKSEYKEFWGLCSGIDNKIYINNAMSIQRTRKTLIHEIAHAITEEVGLKPFINKKDGEKIVEFMAAHYDEIGKVLKELENIKEI